MNFGRLNCGGTPIRVLITHCCAIERMLFVIQYSTKPAGKKKNITLNASGMNHINLACIGSGGTGLSAVCNTVVNVMTSGKIYRAWMDIKAMFSGKDRHTVLSNCETGEDAAQKAYNTALAEEDLPHFLHEMISSQKQILKDSHDEIKALRDQEA